MKNLRSSHPQIGNRFLLIALPLLGLMAASLYARDSLPRSVDALNSRHIKSQGQASHERLEAEVITIMPTGFDPVEITRPAGRFVLSVSNRSRVEDVEFRLDSEAGARLRAVRLPKRKRNWGDAVNLPPGRYLLTEANHPTWKCIITITPRAD